MLEKYFKSASEKFAMPFVLVLAKFRIKPNTVSILGLIIVLLGSYFFYVDNKFLGIILIFLGSAVDGLDAVSYTHLRAHET